MQPEQGKERNFQRSLDQDLSGLSGVLPPIEASELNQLLQARSPGSETSTQPESERELQLRTNIQSELARGNVREAVRLLEVLFTSQRNGSPDTLQNGSVLTAEQIQQISARNDAEVARLTNSPVKTAVLYTHLRPKEGMLDVIVVPPTGEPVHVSSPLDFSLITDKLLPSLNSAVRRTDFSTYSRELAEALFPPRIREVLDAQGINQIVAVHDFIGDSDLRQIPLSGVALASDQGDVVGDRYLLAQLPSFSSLSWDLPLQHKVQDALWIGSSKAFDGLPELPGVRKEHALLQAMSSRGYTLSTLLDTTQSDVSLLNHVVKYDFVAFSSHARGREQNGTLYISSTADAGSIDEAELQNALRGVPGAPRFMLFANCQTATGDGYGIAGSVLRENVSSLATLWSVNDKAAAHASTYVFDQLDSNKSLAQLGREVQQHVRSDPRFNHPHYWNSFQLIGNPWLVLAP